MLTKYTKMEGYNTICARGILCIIAYLLCSYSRPQSDKLQVQNVDTGYMNDIGHTLMSTFTSFSSLMRLITCGVYVYVLCADLFLVYRNDIICMQCVKPTKMCIIRR